MQREATSQVESTATLREMTMKRSNTDDEPAGPSATKT